ncbi:TKL protein kinase [Phytophthora nicotianae CJ01A1]|uniref:TKL protein kinase n=6 Tax=Phytophthora nicotianae TaxID=4792 RepID=V9FQU6_PHYNI|nr:TKL protein kinase [Phytophthora nicotianae P1569]ETK93262.1 TKL protein kinase [Phytophthora nicotianae]ETO82141.1 TKL protein kinase [Phytophthora nicotianae P1976]ETP23209.1 TKL protein kinase [Phytophthora nicotianae CJ01A1]ETP51215.1 TKL protein kinase [Phytophthora nicotianae P10297]
MKVFIPRSVGRLVLPALPLVITSVTAADPDTNASSGSTIIYIVIAVIFILFGIVAFFVWKRKQNRTKRRDDRGYGLPSVTARSGVSRLTSHGNTAFERRMDSTGYSSNSKGNSKSKKVGHSYHSPKQRVERPPQWPANGAPTYTRQQQQQSQYQQQSHYQHQPQYQSQYQESQYQPQQSFPPPPPPEVPMLEPHEDQGPGLSMMELQQSQVSSMQSSVEGVHRRQTDPAVIARTQEAAEKVMAELEEDPEFEESWIPYDSLYFTRSISKGAFGEVWLAQLENTQVAVKKILDEKKHDTKEIECFGAEIKLMALLKHPKIVGFIGVSWSDKQDLCAVTEFMAKGDLYGYLERRKNKLNWPDHKVWLAEDIAEALVYLHSLNPKVIHRDLKSKNILLDNKYRAKLSDFGISRKRSVEETMTAGVGTIYWTAPEVLMGKKYTEKADIYSFGIVMSEMDTCEVPYSDKRDNSGKKLQGMKIIQMVIRMALRPSFREDCPEQIKALAARCLDADPDARPDAPELLDILRDIQEDLQ